MLPALIVSYLAASLGRAKGQQWVFSLLLAADPGSQHYSSLG